MVLKGIQSLNLKRQTPSKQNPKQPNFIFRIGRSEGNRERALQQLERILTISPQRKMFEKFLAAKYEISRIPYETIFDNIRKIVGDLGESELNMALQRGLAKDLLGVQDGYLAREAIEKMWSKYSLAAKETVLNELADILNLSDGIGLQVLLKEKHGLSNRVAHYLHLYTPQIAESLEGVPEAKKLINELIRVRNEFNNAAKNQQPLNDEATRIKLPEKQVVKSQGVDSKEDQTGVWVSNTMGPPVDMFSQYYEEMQTFAGPRNNDVSIPVQATDMVRNIKPGQVFYVGNKLYGIKENHRRFFLWQGASSVQEQIRVPGAGELASNVDFNELGLSFFIARDDDGKIDFLLTCRSMLNNDTEEITYPLALAG
jgi:hypothetical protein